MEPDTTIEYFWTEDDRLACTHPPPDKSGQQLSATQSATPKLVTPYCINAALIDPTSSIKTGDKVTWPDRAALEKASYAKGEVWRFTKEGYSWEKIAVDLLEGETLGELCAHLFKSHPEKYPPEYYAPEQLSSSRGKMPRLMFDYWQNSKFRYAISQAEGAPLWAMDGREIPSGGKDNQWYALVKGPDEKKVPASVGTTTAFFHQSDIDALCDDIEELNKKSQRLQDLLDQARVEMMTRVEVYTRYQALYVLFRCTSLDSREPSQGIEGYPAAATILEYLKKQITEIPIGEDSKAWATSAGSHDISASIHGVALEIRDMLFSKPKPLGSLVLLGSPFPGKIASVFGDAADQGELDTVPIARLRYELARAVGAALEVIGGAGGTEDESDVLMRLFEASTKSPARARGDVKGGNAVELTTAVCGAKTLSFEDRWKSANSWLKIAKTPVNVGSSLLKAAAQFALPGAARAAMGGDMTKLETFAQRLVTAFGTWDQGAAEKLAKGIQDTRKLETDTASKMEHLAEQMGEARGAFMKAVCKFEDSAAWKATAHSLQLVAFVAAVMTATDKDPTQSTTVHVANIINAGAAGTSFAAGTAKTLLKAFGQLNDTKGMLFKTFEYGIRTLDGVAAVVGFVLGACEVVDAVHSGDDWKALVGGMDMVSASFLFAAVICTAFAPELFAVGIVIALAAQLIKGLTSRGGQGEQLGTNQVAAALFDTLSDNAFYLRTMVPPSEELVARAQATVKRTVTGLLPYAENSQLVVESLLHMGFSRDQIKLVINTSTPSEDWFTTTPEKGKPPAPGMYADHLILPPQ